MPPLLDRTTVPISSSRAELTGGGGGAGQSEERHILLVSSGLIQRMSTVSLTLSHSGAPYR